MARPANSGRVMMTALLLIPIFFLLRYLIRESTKFLPIHEYFIWAIVLFQFSQLYYFFTQSYKRFRKERQGEVLYQLTIQPQYPSMIISFALGLLCAGLVYFLNSDSTTRIVGIVITLAIFFSSGFHSLLKIIKFGKAYIKLTDEGFVCFRSGQELKIVWQDVEWVDYITKMMDMRRGYEKIGIVFKLLSGREIEVNTWHWGFGQKDVTDLMRDIGVKMSG